jgi:hypothetical protein
MGHPEEDLLAQQEKIRVDAIDRVSRLTRELSADHAAFAQNSSSFAEATTLIKRALEAAHQLEKALQDPIHRAN